MSKQSIHRYHEEHGSNSRLLTWVVSRFSLISRCTRRAHAAFQPIEKLELSLQSIMGEFELAPAKQRQFEQTQRNNSTLAFRQDGRVSPKSVNKK
jgi:hypothetical protein